MASALKKHHDIALGNIVGSNIFNLAAVMAIPGFVNPVTLDAIAFNRDYMVMLGMTVALLIFCLLQRPATVNRIEGGILTAAYAGYMLVLYNMST